MNKWIVRQFNDGFVEHPERFNFNDIDSGEIVETVDLKFSPGEVYELGNMVSHRGHWQPIENVLGEYDSELLHKQVSYIISKISSLETRMPTYAPLSNANFTNPTSNNPDATDNSNRIATTSQVRAFIQQYPFPPKNVKNLIASTFSIDGTQHIFIGWYNSIDFVFDSMTLSKWEGTKLVFRTDRYPTTETDGTLLVTSNVRPEQSVYDSVADPGVYYFQLFPFSVNGIYNRHVANRALITVPGMTTAMNLSVARSLLAATTDGNGYPYFGGGRLASGYSATVDKFNPADNYRTVLALSEPREMLAAATDGNGLPYFGGGVGAGYLANVDRFSLNENRTTLYLSQGRNNLAATTDGNGYPCFGGGFNYNGSWNYIVDVDKFDLYGNRITKFLISGRENLAATNDKNGSTYFAGGYSSSYYGGYLTQNTVDKFDVNGNRTILSLSIHRNQLAAATDGNGLPYFGGGWTSADSPAPAIRDEVDKFDLYGNRTVLRLSVARQNPAATTDKNGHILFAGGYQYDEPRYVDIVDKFDLYGNRTTYNLQISRNYLAATTNGNGEPLFGGGSTVLSIVSVVDKYIPQ